MRSTKWRRSRWDGRCQRRGRLDDRGSCVRRPRGRRRRRRRRRMDWDRGGGTRTAHREM